MLSSLHNYIKRVRDISVNVSGRASKSVAEHRAILEAIKSKDGCSAEKLTGEHIKNAKKNIEKLK